MIQHNIFYECKNITINNLYIPQIFMPQIGPLNIGIFIYWKTQLLLVK